MLQDTLGYSKLSVATWPTQLRGLISICIAGMLCSCASLNVSQLPPNARYTVVSRFTDGIYYGKVGTTIFNDDFRVEQDDLDVSIPIRNRIVEVLSADSAKQYVPVDFRFPARQWTDNSDAYSKNAVADCGLSDQDKTALSAVATKHDLGLIILICDGTHSFPYGQYFPGRGLSLHQMFNLKTYSTFFNYQIIAYDPKTWNSITYSSLSTRRFSEFAWPTKTSRIPNVVKIAVERAVDNYNPPSDVGFGLCYMKLTNSGQEYIDEVRGTQCNAKYPFGSDVNNGLPYIWFPQLIPR